MPELPEVETICQGLRSNILSKLITDVSRLTSFNLRQVIPIGIESKLIGNKVIDITRRAKYIQIFLSNDYVLLIHLGMTGKLLLKEPNYIPKKHDHFVIYLNNKQSIIYNDPRRFGLIDISHKDKLSNIELFKNLGIEPFSLEFTPEYFSTLLFKKKQPIKLFLMNNKNIVGVGNIYAAESLFLSKISPIREANSLDKNEITTLHSNILFILNESIKHGGSTLKDYAAVSGEKGYFQNSFNVYGREGQPCPICKKNIIKITQAGRSSFYCSTCQI